MGSEGVSNPVVDYTKKRRYPNEGVLQRWFKLVGDEEGREEAVEGLNTPEEARDFLEAPQVADRAE